MLNFLAPLKPSETVASNTRSMSLDGTATFQSDALDGFNNADPFTISLWFKMMSGQSWANAYTTRGLPNHTGIVLGLNGETGGDPRNNVFNFSLVGGNGPSNAVGIVSDAAVADGNWHHAACVYDPTLVNTTTREGMVLYIDGVVQTTSIFSGGIINFQSTPTEPYIGNGTGAANAAESGTSGSCYLDQISTFNIALDSTEVLELYNSGTPTDVEEHSQAGNLQNYWPIGEAPGDDNSNIHDIISGASFSSVNGGSPTLVTDVA